MKLTWGASRFFTRIALMAMATACNPPATTEKAPAGQDESNLTQASFALDSTLVGMNENYVNNYFLNQGIQLPGRPTHDHPRSLAAISCRIGDLATNRNIRGHRDIISFQALQPKKDFNDPLNVSYRAKILDVLTIYKNNNIKLTLSFSQPLPMWMSSLYDRDGAWCIMPDTSQPESKFDELKENMARSVAQFIDWLYRQPGFSSWVANNIWLEGFNEWDHIASTHWTGTECAVQAGANTPLRAAKYQALIRDYIVSYGITMNYTSPSVAGSNKAAFLRDYYNSFPGVPGRPNVHIYERTVSGVANALASINNQLPAYWKNSIFLSEAGFPDYHPSLCPTGQFPGNFWGDVAGNGTIRSMVWGITFWRMDNLYGVAPNANCGALFGGVHADNSGYKNNLWNLIPVMGGTSGAGPNCGE